MPTKPEFSVNPYEGEEKEEELSEEDFLGQGQKEEVEERARKDVDGVIGEEEVKEKIDPSGVLRKKSNQERDKE